MADYNLTWVPPGNGSSLNQNIEYKKAIDSAWTVHSNVSAVTNIALINGLDNNVIYDFRVTSICAHGGPSSSTTYSLIGFVCPAVTLSSTTDSVSYSFTHPAGSISGFTIELLSSSSVVIDSQSPSISGTISGTFSSLTPSTSYKIRVTMLAGSFSNVCTAEDIVTDDLVCDPPTGLTATIA